jgi:hypothetical protein
MSLTRFRQRSQVVGHHDDGDVGPVPKDEGRILPDYGSLARRFVEAARRFRRQTKQGSKCHICLLVFCAHCTATIDLSLSAPPPSLSPKIPSLTIIGNGGQDDQLTNVHPTFITIPMESLLLGYGELVIVS